MDGFDTFSPWSGMNIAALLSRDKKKRPEKVVIKTVKRKVTKSKPRRSKEGFDTKVTKPYIDKKIQTTYKYDDDLLHLQRQLIRLCRDSKSNRLSKVVKCVILQAGTRRRIRKNHVVASELDALTLSVYNRVRKEYAKSHVRKRLDDIMKNTKFSKRLINYFVINFPITVSPVCYFVDKTTYPTRLIGDINSSNQLDITQQIPTNDNIQYVNMYLAYKKHKSLNRHLHVPYGRSPYVSELCYADVTHKTISEINFFLWFDDIAGFEALKRMMIVVKRCKFGFDKSVRGRKNARCKFSKRPFQSLASSQDKADENVPHNPYKRFRTSVTGAASKNYSPYIIEHTWKPRVPIGDNSNNPI